MTDQLFSAAELEELKKDFIVETYEHLENAQDALLQLEKDPANYETLNFIFREIHSIKGGANFLGLQDIINVSHEMESLLDKMRNYEIYPSSDVINAIFEGIDIIRKLADNLENNEQSCIDYTSYIAQLKRIDSSKHSSDTAIQGRIKNNDDFQTSNEPEFARNQEDDKNDGFTNFRINDDDQRIDEDSYQMIVSFEYGDVTYGIEVEFVREIVRPTDVTTIPFAPEHVMGLMNLRGDVVTIVDFGKLLGVEKSESNNHKVLIIGNDELTFGLYVDNVREVVSVLPEEIKKELNVSSISSGEILKGIVERNGEFIQIIDIRKLIERSKNSMELI
ncbi:CheW protein [Caldicellulosiruptor kronotskyensis 2002]|uniref:CheW protein n=1 Tax=Caldicellulosiruptor kronotskyensis (strain DSM 18902 / VKM B-2412 / 2002) TaxID=632348 RepID=E4SGL9_CALK2|nr:chemotaxis protein CheW [Caldicellulosiruptor kronotskyensis]ADQ46894.1 CheW protein [Caldicellulosiruptor kronotskyensis 2002]